MQYIINAYRSTWRTIKITRRIAADACLVLVLFVGWQVAHGHLLKLDGVARAELPFGDPQKATIAQLPADQVLPPQAMQAIPDAKVTKAKLAVEGPRPAEKPSAQVR